jgi:RNA-directed DNA polymerase
MSLWQPQLYRQRAKSANVADEILEAALATASQIVAVHPDLPPIFTLKHLAYLTEVDYGYLRAVVRRQLADPYRAFRIRKRASLGEEQRYRIICAPDQPLKRVQVWIARNILQLTSPHPASIAYAKGSSIFDGAKRHCGCRWLVKLDMRNFFESVSELAVYRVFRELNYQPLICFEMARLCTRSVPGLLRRSARWRVSTYPFRTITAYDAYWMGHLPQGAPTSPMLSNLASRRFDEAVKAIADEFGLVYTRYADDITLSTKDKSFGRQDASRVIAQVYELMGKSGYSPNTTKVKIAPPGARKVVLGLNVDQAKVRLPRTFKLQLRQHLYYLRRPNVGAAAHASARGFSSVVGLRNYVRGLISYSAAIEPNFGQDCMDQFLTIDWPM